MEFKWKTLGDGRRVSYYFFFLLKANPILRIWIFVVCSVTLNNVKVYTGRDMFHKPLDGDFGSDPHDGCFGID